MLKIDGRTLFILNIYKIFVFIISIKKLCASRVRHSGANNLLLHFFIISFYSFIFNKQIQKSKYTSVSAFSFFLWKYVYLHWMNMKICVILINVCNVLCNACNVYSLNVIFFIFFCLNVICLLAAERLKSAINYTV